MTRVMRAHNVDRYTCILSLCHIPTLFNMKCIYLSTYCLCRLWVASIVVVVAATDAWYHHSLGVAAIVANLLYLHPVREGKARVRLVFRDLIYKS